MRILVTNDDGITADGLIRLARAALSFGEVWVVAPDGQRSAASHAITLHDHIDIYPAEFPVDGVRAFSCSKMPGDCVRVGALGVMPEKPDVVLAGINYGYNVSSDVQYSATVGAALEGAFQGCHSIALSEQACDCHEASDEYLPALLEKYISIRPEPGCIWNINFPGCPLKEVNGILEDRTVCTGTVYFDRYNVIKELENGGRRFMVEGIYNEEAGEGTDFQAVVNGYISVGKIRRLGHL